MEPSLKRIAVIDAETDPFEYGKRVAPFAWQFYDGVIRRTFWGDDCTNQLLDFLLELSSDGEDYLIYAHNGGKFDFLMPGMLEEFSGQLRIVNGRILEGTLFGHTMRDSYGILPIPLRAYKKDDTDYSWFKRENREKHKKKIIEYLDSDCTYLHELVCGFHKEFGDKLTIGGTALSLLKKWHPFETVGKQFDEKFRPFYFGGRVQCFEKGILDGNFIVIDVNSEYPYVMRDYKHPISRGHSVDNRIGPNSCFIVVEGWNRGAFPVRLENGGIDFTREYGEFFTTIHEFELAIQLGLFKVKRIKRVYNFDKVCSFEDFVNHFYAKRLEAAAAGDEMLKLFYKLILNSAYGKFAQNPDDFMDYQIAPDSEVLEAPWMPCESLLGYTIWQKPALTRTYYNVATAASITGASRSVLMAGLAKAQRPVYCDTDSIICEAFAGKIDPKELGAWKYEGSGTSIAIAGKKLYAMFNDGDCIKQASKGSHISAQEILTVARGGEVLYRQDAPAFKLDGSVQFIERRIRRT